MIKRILKRHVSLHLGKTVISGHHSVKLDALKSSKCLFALYD